VHTFDDVPRALGWCGCAQLFIVFLHSWKVRNAKIIEQHSIPPREAARGVLKKVVQDLEEWAPHFRRFASHVWVWRDFFISSCV
jgi:hypothetical protein